MIGQNNLKNLIANLGADKFPNSVLLVGEVGSGKKTLIKEVIETALNMTSYDITDSLSFEGIGEIYLSPIPHIYIIDMDKLSVKKNNFILKFLEEPPSICKVILLTSNISNIIPTILSRCTIWYIEKYSKDELMSFLPDNYSETILNYITSPGKLLNKDVLDSVLKIVELSNNIILKCKKVTLSNLLSVSSRIDWDKSDNSKFDLDVFCNTLIISAKDLFKNKYIDGVQYNIISNFINSKDKNSYVFEKFLIELKFYGN